MENTNERKPIWQMIRDGNIDTLTAHMQKVNADLDARIEASRLKIEAEEIANNSGPIVVSEWLGGTKYRIANVRHGVMPDQRTFSTYKAMMDAFNAVQSK